MAEFTEMIASDYGVKKKPITARNSQVNIIIERIHQTIDIMTRSFEVHATTIDEKDLWTTIPSCVPAPLPGPPIPAPPTDIHII
eukprot:1619209-Ditylum_brightwellii.AAC.1